VIVISSKADKSLLSAAVAVMVCKPADRSERWKVAASPMVPSRSDTHRRLAVTSPSSLSLALPVKVMLTPWLNVAPSVGALIVAVGGWLPEE